jgi:hypothetical protein
MKRREFSAGLLIGACWMGLAACAGVGAPARPMVLPQVGNTYAAPYDAVWTATLGSLGVVKTRVADKTTGQIATEPFTFAYTVGAGLDGATQVISVSFRIRVVRVADNRTEVQVTPVIHDSFLSGFTPGPTNNPWQDLFARIRSNLGASA